MKTRRPDVPARVVARLATICLALPGVRQEAAWVGIRWRIGRETFAHVLMIADGWPPAYAKAAGSEGPACVLTFRSRLPEVGDTAFRQPPFFKPVWRPDIAGLFIDARTDWKDVARLVEASYRLRAPKRRGEHNM